MKTPKTTKKSKSKGSSSSGGGAQQFLVWHGEKIIVAGIVVVALWLALQGLSYLGQTLSWPPDELERVAGEAETGIRGSTRTAADEGIELFDHEAHASQIRSPISAEPYKFEALWNPSPEIRQRSPSASSSWER